MHWLVSNYGALHRSLSVKSLPWQSRTEPGTPKRSQTSSTTWRPARSTTRNRRSCPSSSKLWPYGSTLYKEPLHPWGWPRPPHSTKWNRPMRPCCPSFACAGGHVSLDPTAELSHLSRWRVCKLSMLMWSHPCLCTRRLVPGTPTLSQSCPTSSAR